MRRICACTIAVAAALASLDVAVACGDKYVILGQGVRFERAYAAARPATILVYIPASAKLAAPQYRERLITALRLVGHRADAVSTSDELHSAVGANRYDLILTELGTEAELAALARDAQRHPTVIPIVVDPTRDQLRKLHQRDDCVAQFSKQSHELLTTINHVMERREKGVTDACERKRV